MKPNFAFLVSQSTLRLLVDTGTGWAELGDVSTTAPDVDQRLADLRTIAQDMSPDGMLIKLVVPNDYIRYLTLDAHQTQADIDTALEASTPYDINDLAIDIEYTNEHTQVAAVAKEFLAETEKFGLNHGLAPVCFTANPREGSFEREIYFGLARGAERILGAGKTITPTVERMHFVPLPDQPVARSIAPKQSAQQLSVHTEIGQDLGPAAELSVHAQPLAAAVALGDPHSKNNRSDTVLSNTPSTTKAAAPLVAVSDNKATQPAKPVAPRKPAHRATGKRLNRNTILAGIATFGLLFAGGYVLFGGNSRTAPPILQSESPSNTLTPPRASSSTTDTQEAPAATTPTLTTTDEGIVAPVSLMESGPLSAQDAQNFYERTGVWPRGPSQVVPLPARTMDTTTFAPFEPQNIQTLPPSQLASTETLSQDLQPIAPPPPVPLDAEYQFDDNGFVIASKDGSLSPMGVIVFAGEPVIMPKVRPGTVAPIGPEVAGSNISSTAIPVIVPDVAEQPGNLPPQRAAPPKVEDSVAPTALPPLSAPAERAENTPLETKDSAQISPAGEVDVLPIPASAPKIIPPKRPGSRSDAPPTPTQNLQANTLERTPPRLDIIRQGQSTIEAEPTAGGVGVAALLAAAHSGPAILRPHQRPAQLEQRVAELPKSPYAVQQSLLPETRPGNMSRIVANAQPVRRAEPERAATTTQVVSAQPAGPTGRSVAARATNEDVINLRQINLLGVFGSQRNRRALVRLSNGRLVKVALGERLDGGRVTQISGDAIQYSKNGRSITLQIPS